MAKNDQSWGEKWTLRSINTSCRQNLNRATPRSIIIIKCLRKKLRASGEKRNATYKGNSIRLVADFSTETLQTRKWDDIFKILKQNKCQPKILYSVKLSFRNNGGIKTFPNNQKLREFVNTRLALQETPKWC